MTAVSTRAHGRGGTVVVRARLTVVLALGLLAASVSAVAQPVVFRVGWISPHRAVEGSPFLDELRDGLRELGYYRR